ncbi:MAG TPA: hypothetical protein VH083_25750, partial [Myxococcales bacterium]|nr:hypothetical protein [Myxococcales bacterium]
MKALIAALAVLAAPLPARAAQPATADFWSNLLKRFCSPESIAAHPTRKDSCPAAGATLNASASASTLLAALSVSLTSSVRASETQTKTLQLNKDALNHILNNTAPANDAPAGTQGSPAQTDAVPGVAPVAQSGASAGFAGTQTGMRLLASVAVNPAGLMTTSASSTSSTTAAAQKAGTLASRIADISVVVPIDTSGNHKTSPGALGSFDYVGVRVRVNALPFFQDDLYAQAKAHVDKVFADLLATEGKASDAAARLLSAYDDTGCALAIATGATQPAQCQTAPAAGFDAVVIAAARCADAIESSKADQIESQCGHPLPEIEAQRAAELLLYNGLQFRRDQHDADYLGLDIRYDYGDPTFSNDPAARGNYVLAGVAAGHRLLSGGETDPSRRFFGLRARVGWSYSSLTHSQTQTNSFDYAAGLELGTITDFKVLKLSFGVEGRRTSGTVAATVDTNFTDGKIGVDVPLSDGSKLGVVLSIPFNGNHVTTLGLSG